MRPLAGTPWLDYVPASVLILLALGFLAMARAFSPASREVPDLIGTVMLVLCAADLVSRSATPIGRTLTRGLNPAAARPVSDASKPLRSRQLTAVFGVTGLAILLVLVGVLASVPPFILVAIRFGGRRSWGAGVIAAVAVTLLIWILFSVLLRLTLFPGVLFGGDLQA